MIQFLLLRGGAGARLALLLILMLTGLSLRPNVAQASHLRAGDIQAKVDTTASPNPRRIFFKMVLYTDNSSPVDQPSATIFFGDGSSSCIDGIPRAVKRAIPGNTDTSVNIYYFEHIYPATGGYNVEFIGENRNDGVINMTDSKNQSFYIRTYVYIDPALGLNHSPVFTAPAVDKAATSQVFLHNPGAYDADQDSLAFHLRASQQVPAGIRGSVGGFPCSGQGAGTGNNTPAPQSVPNFRYPNDQAITAGNPRAVQVAYEGVPPYIGSPIGVPGADAIFIQDVNTGQITWNAPVAVGFYNVAFEVEEWRRVPLGRRLIGKVIRDMQIIVTASTNLRPTITIPQDICVVAGSRITGAVTAVDGASPSSPQSPITLFAYSGVIPPATFRQTTTGPPQATGTFSWQTTCSNVAKVPYLVVFKAQDNPATPSTTNPVLIDEKTWRITVVGPPPQNLRATPAVAAGGLNSMVLNWDTYTCANAANFYIYRRVNPGPVPGGCETGIPASSGYVRIGTVGPNVTTFTDLNTDPVTKVNRGLDRGQNYCYRIYADFPLPAGGESLASNEACAQVAGRGAMLTNVDVATTSTTTGQIAVRWTQPRPVSGTFTSPVQYNLSRAEGLNPAATAFVPVAHGPFTALADTSYVDQNLDTQNKQYTYKLEFVQALATPISEFSPTASSVRVSALPANVAATAITVNWTFNVPWDNATQPTTIYRRTGNAGPYVRIGTAPSTATGGTYADRDPALVKGQDYCYYVETNGRYPGFTFLSSLLNRSQERCLTLISPPCTPVLKLLTTNCDSLANLNEFPRQGERYSNRLRWTVGNTPAGCDAAPASYKVFYRPTPTGRFTLLGTTTTTSYVHGNLTFSGGCYAIQAVANSGAVSDTSNVACQDNCVFFKLPNIFTPNGDGANDQFRPKNSSPVRRVHFQAFNRWGVKVFENTTTADDPILINWDGGGPTGEKNAKVKTVDGVYFYLAEVEFADFANTKRTYKGWVEIVR
ncbi:gliding motility-associated C-terminal domain-containing protein [Microvirga sp. STS02]|uniref:T9SS type B sorting domain-containing protein n=1 Tax=Hymenobacter negativus TaxID=2795026 RepID=UPI0018DCA51F|nr:MULTISPECIES: gliding motility-associated C-terminal domain-containing protein [Bacteria]MBH8567486.1 gliding motility-associated C-terminal domain-containing protein [Hymenobacter negativus]MBR7207218.1 gliding motility-associated C-terminal domain-containing protein [Microvirga sp. STS02]